MQHIELNRRFIEIQENNQEPESRRQLAAFGYLGFSWEDLLNHPRVVILAEAGMGKTQELKAQAEKLRSQGKYTFFCRIEDLIEEGLEASLDNEVDFRNWTDSSDFGYFLLDSVDEAKLRGKHLRSAFRKLSKALASAVKRSIIIITSRISDWEPLTDLQEFSSKLPADIVKLPESDTLNTKKRNITSSLGDSKPSKDKPLVVELSPLLRDQQRVFAEAQRVNDLDIFFESIDRSNSHIFAQRPEDLLELIAYWKEFGKLGSHEEMHEFNINIKLEERDKERTRFSNLSKQKKLGGVRSLAAALTLCKKSSISIPESVPDVRFRDSSIQPKDVLPDWTDSDLKILLQYPVFDQETYGRIRFHHRSIREYLTACWFQEILEKGAPLEEVEDLLFKEIYGEKVAIPSLRSIIAWLSLWNEKIRKKTLEIAPDILLEGGDAAGLPVEIRDYLLRRYAEQIAENKHADADIGFAEIRRFSHPDLAGAILDLLTCRHQDRAIKHLLLRMISFGDIKACAEEVQAITLDEQEDSQTRVLAIEALASIGTKLQKRHLINVIKSDAKLWPEDLIEETISHLFPDEMDVEELVALIPCFQHVSRKRVASGVIFTLTNIILKSNLCFDREYLLKSFVEFVRSEPFIHEDTPISQRYNWLCPVITVLVESILPTGSISGYLLEAIEIIGVSKDHGLLNRVVVKQ